MASLIEELITILEKEDEIYRDLIPLSQKKTGIIVSNDLKALQDITAKEQSVIDEITGLENRRMKTMGNIGIVMNKDPKTLNMKTMVSLLDKQPAEKRRLSELHDSLTASVNRLRDINNQNKILIEESLEMIEFNMNFIQSTRMLPGNNYDRNASGINTPVGQSGRFDTRQ